jgi:transposase
MDEEDVMARAYSSDLRDVALSDFKSGHSARQVARDLNLGVATAVRWRQLYVSTGQIDAKPLTGHRPLKIKGSFEEEINTILQSKTHFTLASLVEKLSQSGLTVCIWTVWSFLKRRHKSYKKKLFKRRSRTRNGFSANERSGIG